MTIAIADDTLAPSVVRSSTPMLLRTSFKWVLVFENEAIQLNVAPQHRETNANIFSCILTQSCT